MRSLSLPDEPIQFLGDEKDQSILREWYDTLGQSAVKSSIQKIKRREFRPYDDNNFRLIVLCKHPFSGLTSVIEDASKTGDHIKSDRALSTLISSFTRWAESHCVPSEVVLEKRHAFIDWWPMEMQQYVGEDLSPQAQAQLEMSNHILESLDLIRLASIPAPDFLSLWMDSNEPYFAAGRLFYGTFRWVTEVPAISRTNMTLELLRERVGEFAREYVGLARLALLAGADSPLLERTSFVLRRFKVQFATEIPVWLALASELLEGSENLPIHASLATLADYEGIDRVCDRLRLSLVKAVEGLEDEIPALINALLPTLTVPASHTLFETSQGPSS